MTNHEIFEQLLEEGGFTIDNLPLTANNADDEDVIIEKYVDNGEIVWKTTTFQQNDRVRTNIYHSDGTIEELYDE